MPNWCENDLTVEGPLEDVKRFIETMRREEDGEEVLLSANALVPYPQEFRDLDAPAQQWDARFQECRQASANLSEEERKAAYAAFGAEVGPRPKDGFNSGGFEWCQENWGTKWGFCHVTMDPLSDYGTYATAVYHFDTAWTPALPLIRKMGEQFPTLIFDLRYYEGGMGFHGALRVEKSEVILDLSGDYYGSRGG